MSKRNSSYIMSKLIDPEGYAYPAQVGVDITVDCISKLEGGAIIGQSTKHGVSHPVKPVEDRLDDDNLFQIDEVWHLTPGTYAIVFDQGLKQLSAEENASITQRSSLNRNGVRVQGSIYDPGYKCDRLGATLYASVPISIVRHARIAQLIIETNEPVPEALLYNGQYQGEKPKGV